MAEFQKKYAVVIFDDDSVEVIPTTWLVSNLVGRWPRKGSEKQIRKWLRVGKEPGTDWQEVGLTIRAFSNDFKRAGLKANKLQDQSSISDFTEVESEKRRRRMPIRYGGESSSSGSSSEEECIRKKVKRGNEDVFKKPSDVQETQATSGSDSSSRNNPAPCSTCHTLFQQLYAKLETLASSMESLRQHVLKIPVERNELPSDLRMAGLPEGISFPLSCGEDFEKLNDMLKDRMQMATMVNYLNDIGHGKTARSFINSIIKKMLTQSLASKYSLYGRKGKLQFTENRETVNAILAACVKRFPDPSKETLLDYLGRSLSNSNDWSGRKPRPSDISEVDDTLSLDALEG